MLSRVAEAIYWMCRYLERAENAARFAEANLHLTLDLPVELQAQWEPLVRTTGDFDWFSKRYGQATRANTLHFLSVDRDSPNSIVACVSAARENARGVREAISSEMWERLNAFYLETRAAADNPRLLQDSPHDFFAHVRQACQQFWGTMDGTLSRHEAWHFARTGFMLERADKTSRIVDMKYYIILPNVGDVGSPLDNLQWAALLRSASAYEMYRKSYGRIEGQKVAEFLLLDRHFPRAVLYCLLSAEESLNAISGVPNGKGSMSNSAERALGRLRAQLDYTTIEDVVQTGLHEFVDDFQLRLNQVGEAIHQSFFRPQLLPALAAASGTQS